MVQGNGKKSAVDSDKAYLILWHLRLIIKMLRILFEEVAAHKSHECVRNEFLDFALEILGLMWPMGPMGRMGFKMRSIFFGFD
jgi:hypothetical protein